MAFTRPPTLIADAVKRVQQFLRQHPEAPPAEVWACLGYPPGEAGKKQLRDLCLFANNTLMIHAARDGHVPTMQWLVHEAGANPTKRNKQRNTPLMAAARSGQLAAVQWLVLEAGANVHRLSRAGTALLAAVQGNNLSVARWLVEEAGADVNASDNLGHTAVLMAADCGHVAILRWLVQEAGATATEMTRLGHTALHRAAINSHLSVVEWLVRNVAEFANVNECRTSDKQTALHLAGANGDLAVVAWLVREAGADVELVCRHYRTVLQLAAKNRRHSVVEWLVRSGHAKVASHDIDGNNALQLAAPHDLKTVKLLVQVGGTNVDWQNENGDTALIIAARAGKGAIVRWLLGDGQADPTITNTSGQSAVDVTRLTSIQTLITEAMAKECLPPK
eukprot:m.426889 g.426889  ORF g.426889 m.426889 type:complete len:392 (+) comp20223_c0_seq2:196-1371(+)